MIHTDYGKCLLPSAGPGYPVKVLQEPYCSVRCKSVGINLQGQRKKVWQGFLGHFKKLTPQGLIWQLSRYNLLR